MVLRYRYINSFLTPWRSVSTLFRQTCYDCSRCSQKRVCYDAWFYIQNQIVTCRSSSNLPIIWPERKIMKGVHWRSRDWDIPTDGASLLFSNRRQLQQERNICCSANISIPPFPYCSAWVAFKPDSAESDKRLMKFGVSITALIRLSLTKYLFTPRLEERLKTSEQFSLLFFLFSLPLKEQPWFFRANLASCLTCVNF